MSFDTNLPPSLTSSPIIEDENSEELTKSSSTTDFPSLGWEQHPVIAAVMWILGPERAASATSVATTVAAGGSQLLSVLTSPSSLASLATTALNGIGDQSSRLEETGNTTSRVDEDGREEVDTSEEVMRRYHQKKQIHHHTGLIRNRNLQMDDKLNPEDPEGGDEEDNGLPFARIHAVDTLSEHLSTYPDCDFTNLGTGEADLQAAIAATVAWGSGASETTRRVVLTPSVLFHAQNVTNGTTSVCQTGTPITKYDGGTPIRAYCFTPGSRDGSSVNGSPAWGFWVPITPPDINLTMKSAISTSSSIGLNHGNNPRYRHVPTPPLQALTATMLASISPALKATETKLC